MAHRCAMLGGMDGHLAVQCSVAFIAVVFVARCVLLCFDTWACRACNYRFLTWHWRRVKICPRCLFAQVVQRRGL